MYNGRNRRKMYERKEELNLYSEIYDTKLNVFSYKMNENVDEQKEELN